MDFNDLFGVDIDPDTIDHLAVHIDASRNYTNIVFWFSVRRELGISVNVEVKYANDMRQGLYYAKQIAMSVLGTDSRCSCTQNPRDGVWSYVFFSADDHRANAESILASDADLPGIPVEMSETKTGRRFIRLSGRQKRHYVDTIDAMSIWRRGEKAYFTFACGKQAFQCDIVYTDAEAVREVVDYVMPNHTADVKTDYGVTVYSYWRTTVNGHASLLNKDDADRAMRMIMQEKWPDWKSG